MMRHQKLIQTLQGRNSTSALFENLNNASSYTITGPVTPEINLKSFENILTIKKMFWH
jgi:hypothetical protein